MSKLEKSQICNIKWISWSGQELLVAVKTTGRKVAGKIYNRCVRPQNTYQS